MATDAGTGVESKGCTLTQLAYAGVVGRDIAFMGISQTSSFFRWRAARAPLVAGVVLGLCAKSTLFERRIWISVRSWMIGDTQVAADRRNGNGQNMKER